VYAKRFTSIGEAAKTAPNPRVLTDGDKTYRHARELDDKKLER
jgi:hypothetical protein